MSEIVNDTNQTVTSDPVSSGSGGDPIWARLARAREAAGLSVADVAAQLKLTAKQIEAMERGDLAQLPGAAFARGFMRNYARFLHLDPDPFVMALSEAVPTNDANFPARQASLGRMPQPGQTDPWSRVAMLSSLLVLGIVIAGWYFGWLEAEEEIPESAPVVAELSGDASAPGMVAPVATENAPPLAGSMAVAPASVPAASAASVVAAQVSAPAVASASAAVASSSPAASGRGKRLSFRFAGEAWVEVRNGRDEVVFSRLNPAGSELNLNAAPPLSLVVGNASQVELQYDGRRIDLTPYTRVMVARFHLD